MEERTLVFLFQHGKIFLAKKKRGFGVDRYNGYGGKFEKDEKPITCAKRN